MAFDPERLLRKNWTSVNEFAREMYVMIKGGTEPTPARAVTPTPGPAMIPNPTNVVQQVFNQHQQIANEQMMARIDEVFAVQAAKQSGYVSPPESHRVPEPTPLPEKTVEPAIPLISRGPGEDFQFASATAVAYGEAPARVHETHVQPARPYDFPDFISRPVATQGPPRPRPAIPTPREVPQDIQVKQELRETAEAAEVRDYALDLGGSEPVPLESRYVGSTLDTPIEGTSFETPATYRVADMAPEAEAAGPPAYRTQGHDQEIPPVPLIRVIPNTLEVLIGVTDSDGVSGLATSSGSGTYGTAGTGMCKFLDFDNEGGVVYADEDPVQAWNLSKSSIGSTRPVFLMLVSNSWFVFPVGGGGVIHGIVTATIGPYVVGGSPGTGKVQIFTKVAGTWVTSGVPVDVINWFNVTAAVNKHCLISDSDGGYTLVSLDC